MTQPNWFADIETIGEWRERQGAIVRFLTQLPGIGGTICVFLYGRAKKR